MLRTNSSAIVARPFSFMLCRIQVLIMTFPFIAGWLRSWVRSWTCWPVHWSGLCKRMLNTVRLGDFFVAERRESSGYSRFACTSPDGSRRTAAEEPDGLRRTARKAGRCKRSLRFETLQSRLAMASDVAMMSPVFAAQSSQAEGEPAPDLVAFAKALTAGGARLFGADYVQFVTDQLNVFQDGARYLKYLEVVDGNREPNSVAAAEGIAAVPTWKFSSGDPVVDFVSLQNISTRSGIPIPLSSTPSFFPIEAQTVKVGSPLHIPIDAYDPNGNPLTITVSSSNQSNVSAQVLANNPSARITVEIGRAHV